MTNDDVRAWYQHCTDRARMNMKRDGKLLPIAFFFFESVDPLETIRSIGLLSLTQEYRFERHRTVSGGEAGMLMFPMLANAETLLGSMSLFDERMRETLGALDAAMPEKFRQQHEAHELREQILKSILKMMRIETGDVMGWTLACIGSKLNASAVVLVQEAWLKHIEGKPGQSAEEARPPGPVRDMAGRIEVVLTQFETRDGAREMSFCEVVRRRPDDEKSPVRHVRAPRAYPSVTFEGRMTNLLFPRAAPWADVQ